MVRVIGENGTKEVLKKAMFTITIGSNDILNYIQPSIPFFSQDKLPNDVLQDSMVFHLTTHLKVIQIVHYEKFPHISFLVDLFLKISFFFFENQQLLLYQLFTSLFILKVFENDYV